MAQAPKFTVEFYSQSTGSLVWPHSWLVNHDGPLEAVKIAAYSTMKAETFPTATGFVIHDNEKKSEVFGSNA